jgi:hypothetical protein
MVFPLACLRFALQGAVRNRRRVTDGATVAAAAAAGARTRAGGKTISSPRVQPVEQRTASSRTANAAAVSSGDQAKASLEPAEEEVVAVEAEAVGIQRTISSAMAGVGLSTAGQAAAVAVVAAGSRTRHRRGTEGRHQRRSLPQEDQDRHRQEGRAALVAGSVAAVAETRHATSYRAGAEPARLEAVAAGSGAAAAAAVGAAEEEEGGLALSLRLAGGKNQPSEPTTRTSSCVAAVLLLLLFCWFGRSQREIRAAAVLASCCGQRQQQRPSRSLSSVSLRVQCARGCVWLLVWRGCTMCTYSHDDDDDDAAIQNRLFTVSLFSSNTYVQ